MTPKISVIVPTFNTEKYLRCCVDSILAQTFTDYELLLIDDGSTDGSEVICDKYAEKDTRIKVLHKNNGGVSSARNLGLDNAKGEWITFCDSDDWVFPCWLDNFMSKEVSNEIDLLIQGFKTDRSIGEILKEDTEQYYGANFESPVKDAITNLIQSGIFGYVWNKCFRRDCIETHKLRFDCSLSLHEDEMFIIDFLAYAKKVRSVSNIGYYYHVPDWGAKYKFEFSRFVSLFNKADKNGFVPLQKKYGRYITERLTGKYNETSFHNKVEIIGLLKQLFYKKEKFCTIHPVAKTLILNCPIDCVSALIFSCYQSVKK